MQVAANDMNSVAAMLAKQAAAIQSVMSQGSNDSSADQQKAEGGAPPPPGTAIAAVAYSGSGASAGSVFAAAVMATTAAPAPAPAPAPVADDAADAGPTLAETAAKAAKHAVMAAEQSQVQIEQAQARATRFNDWVGRWDAKLEEAGIDPTTNKPFATDTAPVVGFAGYMMTTGEDGSTTIFAAMSTSGGDAAEVPLTDEQQALVDKAMGARERAERVNERSAMQIETAQARADKYAHYADRWAEKAGLPLPSASAVTDAEVIEETPAATTTAAATPTTSAAELATDTAAAAEYTPAASTAATSSTAVNDFFAFLSQMHEDKGMEYDGVVYTSTDGAEFAPVTQATVENAEITETVASVGDDTPAPAVTNAPAPTVQTGGRPSGLPQFGSFEALFAPLFDFMNAFQQAFSGFQQRSA